MTPLLKECHKDVFIDSQLMELVVPAFVVPRDPSPIVRLNALVMYLSGVARANNAEFRVEGKSVYLRASDIPQAQVMDLGIIDQDDLERLERLKWDLLPFGGRWLVEIPVAHKDYLNKIEQIERLPFSLQFNIAFFEDGAEKATGISLETFIDMNIDYFDQVRAGDVDKLLDATSTGFRFSWRPSALETSFNETITTSLAGMLGDDALVNLSDQIPYKISSLGREGFRVSQNVDFVEAGFKCLVKSASIPTGVVFDFDVENSTADFSRTVDGLPVIRRRQVKSRRLLKVGEPVEVARIESELVDQNYKGLPFIKKLRDRRKVSRYGTISVIVKRTE